MIELYAKALGLNKVLQRKPQQLLEDHLGLG
jgi:hypothetical protein